MDNNEEKSRKKFKIKKTVLNKKIQNTEEKKEDKYPKSEENNSENKNQEENSNSKSSGQKSFQDKNPSDSEAEKPKLKQGIVGGRNVEDSRSNTRTVLRRKNDFSRNNNGANNNYNRNNQNGGGFNRGPGQGSSFNRNQNGGGFNRGPGQGSSFNRNQNGGGFNRGPGQGSSFNRGPGGPQNRGGGFNRGPGQGSSFNRGPGGPQNRGGGFNRGPGQGSSFNRSTNPSNRGSSLSKKDKKEYSKKEREERNEKEFNIKRIQDSLASVPREIVIGDSITISELAKKMNLKAGQIIQTLMRKGVMVNITQSIDSDTASLICMDYNCNVKVESLYEQTQISEKQDLEEDLKPRSPIVTIMGHVDHGKTRLLDTIRKTNIMDKESGGITQHVGAYKVYLSEEKSITFIDTPGHEAFAKMRSRGSQVTDIVILVVSAVDGVMPQTVEAINHSKEAGVPIVVAINKIDLDGANPEMIKTQLGEYGLIPEEWGGTTIYNEISAKQNIGITELLESILLQAEVLELKANPKKQGLGKVIESQVIKGKGVIITTLIMSGVVKIGDPFVAGIHFGKIKGMFDHNGKKLTEAKPSDPVEIMGCDGIPFPGDPFNVVASEKAGKELSDKRKDLKKQEQFKTFKKVNLDNLYESIKDGKIKELKLVIKADVQGSIEAISSELKKLNNEEVRVNIIHSGVGEITESDIMLASPSNAIIIGFKVRPNANAMSLQQEEKVDIRKYNVIYEISDDIKEALSGLLSPEIKEVHLGKVEVRKIFKSTKIGNIAGCAVLEGKVKKGALVNIIRDNIVINHDVNIGSLRVEKSNTNEVSAGFECGIVLQKLNDIAEGDIFEVYEYKEYKKTLK